MNRAEPRTLLTGKAPPRPIQTSLDPLEELARAAAVSRAADAREALQDLPNFDPRGRPVPRYYLLESYPRATPPGWWRDVGLAPESLRKAIRREPDSYIVVEMVGKGGGPFAFRLSDLEMP